MSSKPSHTPGPWRLGSGATVTGDYIEPDGRNKGATAVVADCRTRFLSQQTCEANARLIAAAPELLHAAIDLLESRIGHQITLNHDDPGAEACGESDCVICAMRQAIRKATGEA